MKKAFAVLTGIVVIPSVVISVAFWEKWQKLWD